MGEPISSEKLKFLLGLDYSKPESLAARGVTAMYRSQRFNLNKYYASFRVPELAFGGISGGGELSESRATDWRAKWRERSQGDNWLGGMGVGYAAIGADVELGL